MEKEIEFLSFWKANDCRKYSYKHTKIKRKEGAIVNEKIKEKVIALKVMDVYKDSYLIEWQEFQQTWKKNFLDGIMNKIIPENKLIFSIAYLTDEEGAFEELVESAQLDEQVNLLKKELAKIGESEIEMELLDATFSKEILMNKMLKTILIFHYPYGESFANPPVIESMELANPLMPNNNIPGEYIYTLIYYNEETGIGEIEVEKKYDQNELNKVIKATLVDLHSKIAKNRKDKGEAPKFIAQEKFWYKVNFHSGWIIAMKHEKYFLTKNDEAIDRTEFKLLE